MARNFAGGTDNLLTSGNVAFSAGAVTFAGWAYETGVQTTRAIFRVGGGSGASFGAYGDSGKWAMLLNGSIVDFTGSFSNGIWYHIAATGTIGSSVSWSFYTNGVATGTSAATTVAATNNTVEIGNDGFSQPWIGALADMAWWNVALSPANIATLAAGARANTVQSGSLILYYPIKCQSPEPDLAQGNNATVTGTTCTADPPLLTPPPFMTANAPLIFI